MNEELVSIIGSSYFSPISMLLEKLRFYFDGSEGEIMASVNVNGYACSVCLLGVVCLESYVMRARYIHEASGEDLNKLPVTRFIKKYYSDYPYIDETSEAFITRDLIAHNHLLKTSYTIEDYGMQQTGVERVSSGDRKFTANVCKETEKTKILGLNTNPIKIGYRDAATVLKIVWENLLFLEKKDRNQCYVSHLHVKHQGESILFGELINLL